MGCYLGAFFLQLDGLAKDMGKSRRNCDRGWSCGGTFTGKRG